MPLNTIRYKILPNGTIQEEVLGAMGHTCVQTTEPIEKALGTVVDRKLLAAFFVTDSQPQEARIQSLEDEDWRGCCDTFGCAL